MAEIAVVRITPKSFHTPSVDCGHFTLPFQRSEFLLHCRGNESQIGVLNHRDTGAGLCRHRQRIDSIDLKQFADTSVAETVCGRMSRDSSLFARVPIMAEKPRAADNPLAGWMVRLCR